jgi:hypothetical protein
MTADDDRIAYLEGEDRSRLDAEERRSLDGIRGLLADPSLWEEPGAGLEAEIVAAISAQAGAARQAGRERPLRNRRRLLTAAAAVVVVLASGTIAFRPWQAGDPAAQHFVAALSPTPLAREASGDATLTKTSSGWRIALHAKGLTRLDGDRYYQAWLKDAAGTLVPIGTFNDARKVTLWAGVTPTEYFTLTITIEAADGNQASSGRRVLVGTISH